MVHAVYKRELGGYWVAVDPRTPNWFFAADTRAQVLRIWHDEWRVRRNLERTTRSNKSARTRAIFQRILNEDAALLEALSK